MTIEHQSHHPPPVMESLKLGDRLRREGAGRTWEGWNHLELCEWADRERELVSQTDRHHGMGVW